MGHLEGIQRCHPSILYIGFYYKPLRNIWITWSNLWSCYVYDRTSIVSLVSTQLFTQKGRTIDGLPPTQLSCAHPAYQERHLPGWSLIELGPDDNCSSRASLNGGWRRKAEGGWEVRWTTLPEATQACTELICCGSVQEGLQRTLQVSKGCSAVHCSLCAGWTLH